MITFRSAIPGDSHQLGHFLVKAWRDSFVGIVPQTSLDKEDPLEAEKRCSALIADPTRLSIVAIRNEEIVGLVFAVLPEVGEREGRIKSLFVAKPYLRCGIGRGLMQRMAGKLIDHGATALTLGVFRENHNARRFYEAHGGVPTHELPLEWDGHLLPETQYRFTNLHVLAGRDDV